jgi:hypothetical protein
VDLAVSAALALAGLVLLARGTVTMEPGPLAELSTLAGLLSAALAVALALT